MSYRIAVATSDGRYVDSHYGHTSEFLIGTVEEDGSFEEIGWRSVTAVCGDGDCGLSHEDRMDRTARQLRDVAYVLCVRIGPPAASSLQKYGIRAASVSGPVGEAVKLLNRYVKEQRKEEGDGTDRP